MRVAALVPARLRRRVSASLGHVDERRCLAELKAAASNGRPIIAGPWLGEVGFELLYWAPFLRWVAERFAIRADRWLVVSRGGTKAWYEPFAIHYKDVLEYLTPEAYRAHHDARVREIGEQKQTRVLQFERDLVEMIAADAGIAGASLLHPMLMYGLLRRFWWGHLDERWVHGHARYVRYPAGPRPHVPDLPEGYCAVKFYFNDCFPETERNRAFVAAVVDRLSRELPIVSLSSGLTLDDHGSCAVGAHAVVEPAGAASPAANLALQSAIVAHARRFVGTYGGFAYMAPFYGVPSISYYDDSDGFARVHLRMARSAFAAIGTDDLLRVHPTPGESRLTGTA